MKSKKRLHFQDDGKYRKADFVAMVKKQAKKVTPAITVLRPERDKRVSKELPSYVSNEDHKKAAQKDILALIQRKR